MFFAALLNLFDCYSISIFDTFLSQRADKHWLLKTDSHFRLITMQVPTVQYLVWRRKSGTCIYMGPSLATQGRLALLWGNCYMYIDFLILVLSYNSASDSALVRNSPWQDSILSITDSSWGIHRALPCSPPLRDNSQSFVSLPLGLHRALSLHNIPWGIHKVPMIKSLEGFTGVRLPMALPWGIHRALSCSPPLRDNSQSFALLASR
jgi:hypothetical protein